MALQKCCFLLAAGVLIMADEYEDFFGGNPLGQNEIERMRYEAGVTGSREVYKDNDTMKVVNKLHEDSLKTVKEVMRFLHDEDTKEDKRYNGIVRIVEGERKIFHELKEMWDRIGHNASRVNEKLYQSVTTILKMVGEFRTNETADYGEKVLHIQPLVFEVLLVKNELVMDHVVPYNRNFYVIYNVVMHALDYDDVEEL